MSTPTNIISSPCTGVCTLDAGGLCVGCRRSIEEIMHWATLDEATRRRLMEQALPARRRDEEPTP